MPPKSNPPIPDSIKPYLLRAVYQWAVDSRLTPQVLVEADAEQVTVPRDRVKDGRIVLNIHPHSIKGLDMGNEYLLFSARFGGKPFEVCIPVGAVAAIYCRENGRGMVFHATESDTQVADKSANHTATNSAANNPRSKIRTVKTQSKTKVGKIRGKKLDTDPTKKTRSKKSKKKSHLRLVE